MKNLLLLLLFTLFYGQTLGCLCIPPPLMETYQGSDFVAVVKILQSTLDPRNDTYRTVEIETINQYKGTPTKSLRVNTSAHSNCAFSIPVNSTCGPELSEKPGKDAGSTALYENERTGKR